MDKPLILYDGVCHLCNGFVRFVIKRDPRKQLQFGHLQSPDVRRRLMKFPEAVKHFDTVVFLENDQVFTRSAAALRITRYLSGAWPLAYGLRIIPAFLRDAVYDLVSRHRYRMFGRSNECILPSPENKDRFID